MNLSMRFIDPWDLTLEVIALLIRNQRLYMVQRLLIKSLLCRGWLLLNRLMSAGLLLAAILYKDF